MSQSYLNYYTNKDRQSTVKETKIDKLRREREAANIAGGITGAKAAVSIPKFFRDLMDQRLFETDDLGKPVWSRKAPKNLIDAWWPNESDYVKNNPSFEQISGFPLSLSGGFSGDVKSVQGATSTANTFNTGMRGATGVTDASTLGDVSNKGLISISEKAGSGIGQTMGKVLPGVGTGLGILGMVNSKNDSQFAGGALQTVGGVGSLLSALGVLGSAFGPIGWGLSGLGGLLGLFG